MDRIQKMSSIVQAIRNHKVEAALEDKIYIVTGFLYNSKKRFKLSYKNIDTALMINLCRGSVWEYDAMLNKKRLIKRVNN